MRRKERDGGARSAWSTEELDLGLRARFVGKHERNIRGLRWLGDERLKKNSNPVHKQYESSWIRPSWMRMQFFFSSQSASLLLLSLLKLLF